jgi:hypothetical protein
MTTLFHEFALQRLSENPPLLVTLPFEGVDGQINEVLSRHHHLPWWAYDDTPLPPWPTVGDGSCLGKYQWCDESLYLAFDGTHNYVLSSSDVLPDVPCRQATPIEFRDIAERVSVAVAISRRPSVPAGDKSKKITAALREATDYVQRICV